MEIFLTRALGRGKTVISAFDDSLIKAGIGNFNLIKLSSIIPTGSILKFRKKPAPANEFGYKLFAVWAMQMAESRQSAWAGLGWVQRPDGSGFFVEHETNSRAELIRLLNISLKEMKKRRNWPNYLNHHLIIGGKADNNFVCALVVAKYKSQNWQ